MAHEADFAEFWNHYPLRVGKKAAQREYEKARKEASADDILVGVEAYKRAKPSWQEWAHPRTWLHQGRWADEHQTASSPVTERPMNGREVEAFQAWLRAMGGCGHSPRCESRAECGQRFVRRYRGMAAAS
jgi:hypothetical protein